MSEVGDLRVFRILIVDDEEALTELVQAQLQTLLPDHRTWEFVCLHDIDSALKEDPKKYDLFILDIDLKDEDPIRNGIYLATVYYEKLGDSRLQLPIVFLSGGPSTDLFRAAQVGPPNARVDSVPKPFDLSKLVDAVKFVAPTLFDQKDQSKSPGSLSC